jgi:hypothetical protein
LCPGSALLNFVSLAEQNDGLVTTDDARQAGFTDSVLARLVRGDLDREERQRLKTALLAYCRQDTLAMAKVLDRLRILASGSSATAARG